MRIKFRLAFASVIVDGVKNVAPELLISGTGKFDNLPISINVGVKFSLEKRNKKIFSTALKLIMTARKKNCFVKQRKDSSEFSDVMSGDTEEVGSRST